MSKLANKLAYLKETVAILKENISSITGYNYEGWSLRSVVETLGNISVHQSPFTNLAEGTYTDHFGTVTVGSSSDYVNSVFSSATGIMKSTTVNENGFVSLEVSPDSEKSYFDLSYGGVKELHLRTSPIFYNPMCVIFPEKVSGEYTRPEIILYSNSAALGRGLYLPKSFSYTSSTWITLYSIVSSKEVPVKCPVGTEISAIYLHQLPMSATTMVGLFNNLKDVSSESATYRIQVGSTNLAKLSTAQKNIAINKGWILS